MPDEDRRVEVSDEAQELVDGVKEAATTYGGTLYDGHWSEVTEARRDLLNYIAKLERSAASARTRERAGERG